MSESTRSKVAKVISPFGPLTIADLPSPETQRWSIRRKVEVIAAVRGGLLSMEEACSRYALDIEEYLSWEYCIDRYGPPGLRATLIQFYLPNGERKVAGRACGSKATASAMRESPSDPANGRYFTVGGLGSGFTAWGNNAAGTGPPSGASTSIFCMTREGRAGFSVAWRAAHTTVHVSASVAENGCDIPSSATNELPLQSD
jgi:Protein of unknown function (DUF1153)